MYITTKWMTHPKDSAAQLFLPSLIGVSALVALASLLYGLGGENPVEPVASFLSDTWQVLSPLGLFMVAVWAFHFISYLLVGSFAKDLSIAARMVRRLRCAYWHRFFRSWTWPALCLGFASPLAQVRRFRRSQPRRLAPGWRAGDSMQLE